MNYFYANQYNIQATGRNDQVNTNHLCDMVGGNEGNVLQSKSF